MPLNLWKRAATLFAAAFAMALATAPAARAQSGGGEFVYVACYVFTAGGDGTAATLPPYRIATNTVRVLYPESMVSNYGLPEAAGYNNERCRLTATAEEAEDWFRASGYRMVKRMEWPKVLWTRLQPGPWVACLKSLAGGPGITPAFQTDAPDYRARLDADAVARFGDSTYVTCDYGPTREDVERKIRNHYTSPTHEWPLPWSGERRASAPPPKPAISSKPSSPGALTIKTDTSMKDAAKAWDEQVKKTLAAEAQKKVELAAKTAQADKKHQAEMEAFFAERRRQGSRQ